MLEVTSAGTEASLKVNFTNVYRKSELYRLDSLLNPINIGNQMLFCFFFFSLDISNQRLLSSFCLLLLSFSVFTFNLQNCHLVSNLFPAFKNLYRKQRKQAKKQLFSLSTVEIFENRKLIEYKVTIL